MGVEIKRVNSYLDEGGKTMFLESLEKLKEEAIADGRAEGLEQGLEEGIHKANIEIAKRMLAKGYAIKEIVELTGFSAAEINKLKSNSSS